MKGEREREIFNDIDIFGLNLSYNLERLSFQEQSIVAAKRILSMV